MNYRASKSPTLAFPRLPSGIWPLTNKPYKVIQSSHTYTITVEFRCCWPRLGEQPLQVARCTKVINEGSDGAKYIINVKQFAKFVVDLADTVSPTYIEEGMRVG